MQNIQDKEFDQLFRDRFEGAETEPSGDLWGNIEAQLGNKPNRVFPVYWIAAALCAVAVTAGVLFRQPEKRETIVQTVSSEHRSANREIAGKIAVKQQTSAVIDPVVPVSGSSSVAAVQSSSEKAIVVEPAGVQSSGIKKDLTAMQPLMLVAHPENRTVSVKQKKEQLPESAKETPEEPVLAGTDAAKDEIIETREKHRGIRNIGDLVNYVVNKLDKREEKMLKFETNDDESSLIGINIGMIRFSRKDKNNN